MRSSWLPSLPRLALPLSNDKHRPGVSEYRRQWRALEGWERATLIRLTLLLPIVGAGLRLFGFNWMRQFAECGHRHCAVAKPTLPPGQSSQSYAQRCAELAAVAARHGIYRARCLPQALALCWLLQQKHLPARICIGTKPQTKPFMAHAWVELDKMPLGHPVAGYKVFAHATADADQTGSI
jgi:hypothetical protein